MLKVFEKKPETAKSSNHTVARITKGLTCTVTEGNHQFVADMPDIMGGDGAGPSPGVFGRTAVASCVAMGVKMTAVRAGLSIDSIGVELEMDWDDVGMFGADLAYAGPIASRLHINIVSNSPADEITSMVDGALAADPWYRALKDAQNVIADVSLTRPPEVKE